jgi:hypothetical protein
MSKNNDNYNWIIVLILLILFLIASNKHPSNSENSKGKLLIRKERNIREEINYYERKIEYQRTDTLKFEIYEPKGLAKIRDFISRIEKEKSNKIIVIKKIFEKIKRIYKRLKDLLVIINNIVNILKELLLK